MSDVSWNIGLNGSSFIEWTREVSAAFERHRAACEPAPLRHPRTALHLLRPWAPAEDDLDDLEIHGGTIVSGSTVHEDGKWILYVPREEAPA